jgi:hypothetical protein
MPYNYNLTGLPRKTNDPKPMALTFDNDEDRDSLFSTFKGYYEAFKQGWENSVTGLAMADELPTNKHLDFDEEVVSFIGQTLGDLPPAIVGGLLGMGGGNPLTVVGGSMAMTEGMRKMYMDKLERGEIKDAREFMHRLSGATLAAVKGEALGMTAGKAGEVVGTGMSKVTAGMSSAATAKVTAGLVQAPAEAAAMATAGALMDLRAPTMEDFKMAAAGVVGMHVSKAIALPKKTVDHVSKKLQDNYRETGTLPDKVVADAQRDPALMQDLLSLNKSIEDTYNAKLKGLDNRKAPRNKKEKERRKKERAKIEQERQKALESLKKKQEELEKAKDPEAETEAPEITDKEILDTIEKDVDGAPAEMPITSIEDKIDFEGKPHSSLEKRKRDIITEQMIDKYDPLYRWVNKLTGDGAFAEKAATALNPYKAQRLYEGTKGKVEYFLKHGTFDRNTLKDTGAGYSQIIKKVGERRQEFSVYLVAHEARNMEASFKFQRDQKLYDLGTKHSKLNDRLVKLEDQKRSLMADSKTVADIRTHERTTGTINRLKRRLEAQERRIEKAQKEHGDKRPATVKRLTDARDNTIKRITELKQSNAELLKKPGIATSVRQHERAVTKLKKVNKELEALKKERTELENAAPEGISGFEFADKDSYIKNLEAKHSDFVELRKEFIKYCDGLYTYMRDAGIISQEQYAKRNLEYIPMKRVVPNEKNSVTAQRKGSDRPVVDPLLQVIKDTSLAITLAERNAVHKSIVDFGLKYDPNMKLVKKGEMKKVRPFEELREEAARHGLDPDAIDVEIYREPKDVIEVFENGQRRKYTIDPEIKRMLESVDAQSAKVLNNMLKPLRGLTNLKRAGATSLNLDFGPKNVFRDTVSAFINSKYGITPGWSTVQGLFSSINRDDLYKKWVKAGGDNAMMVSLDKPHLKDTMIKELQGIPLFNKITNPKELGKMGLHALQTVSEHSEKANRLSEFKAGLKHGDSALDAAFASREVTLDFAKSGHMGKEINRLVPFHNAFVQDINKVYRLFKHDPVTATMRCTIGITLPSLITAYLGKDDQEIQDLPAWQKDLFWCVRIGSGDSSFIARIPKPHLLGVAFGTVPERIFDWIINEDPHAFDGLMESFKSVGTPPLMPSGIDTLTSVLTNYDYFRDTDIVPSALEYRLPEYQYTDRTTELSKSISKYLSPLTGNSKFTSPIMLEHIVQSMTAGVGKMVIEAADYAARKSGILDDPLRAASTLADMPIVRSFVARHPSYGAAPIQRFREQYKKLEKIATTVSMLQDENRFAEALKYLPDNNLHMVKNYHDHMASQIKLINYINTAPPRQGVPREDQEKLRRQMIDQLYKNLIETARLGNIMLDRIESLKEEEQDGLQLY